MSVATPTLLPRPPMFPTLLPRPPQPHPVPLPREGREPGRLNLRRDWARDMDDLSDEEAELDDNRNEVKNRGYTFLIPIGKTFTQHEEKNDADDGSEGEDSDAAGASPLASDGPSEGEEEEEEEDEEDGEDLDADMEDMDEEQDETTVDEGDTNEF